jgi:hypothetical protein
VPDKKPPTRFESALGIVLFVSALAFMGKRCASSPEPVVAAPCQTDLDCRIRANTERLRKSCVAAASAQRHLEDQQFDVAQGLRTGKLSASEVRSEAGTLGARQRIASEAKAECEAARAEASALGDEATRVVRERERLAAKAAPTPTPKPAIAAKPAKSKRTTVATQP